MGRGDIVFQSDGMGRQGFQLCQVAIDEMFFNVGASHLEFSEHGLFHCLAPLVHQIRFQR